MKNIKGQSIVEYSIVIGLIVGIFIAMNPFIKRSIQSMIKLTADQIGEQKNADQTFDEKRGYLVSSNTSVSSEVRDNLSEQKENRATTIYQSTNTTTSSKTNLGAREDE